MELESKILLHIINQKNAGADAIQIFDSWAGLLKLEDLDELAFSQGFKKEAIIQMPANNLSIIYIKV